MVKSIYPLLFAPLVSIILFFTPFCSSAQALRGQSELSLGGGGQSFYRMIDGLFSFSGDNYHSYGAYNLSYRYHFTNRFTFGINLAYEQIRVKSIGSYEDNSRQDFMTASPEVTFSYIDKVVGKNTGIRLYWVAAWGITAFSGSNADGSKDHGVLPLGIQLTPIGMRIGGDLAGFVEMGFGYKGLLSIGASFRFPRKIQPKPHDIDKSRFNGGNE